MTAARSAEPAGDDVSAYLRRLGLEREPPTPAALRRIHRAQVETVPYETAWIHQAKCARQLNSITHPRAASMGRRRRLQLPTPVPVLDEAPNSAWEFTTVFTTARAPARG